MLEVTTWLYFERPHHTFYKGVLSPTLSSRVPTSSSCPVSLEPIQRETETQSGSEQTEALFSQQRSHLEVRAPPYSTWSAATGRGCFTASRQGAGLSRGGAGLCTRPAAAAILNRGASGGASDRGRSWGGRCALFRQHPGPDGLGGRGLCTGPL